MPAEDPVRLSTALGTRLHFVSMQGREEISRLFEYTVLADDEQPGGVDLEALIGRPAEVTIKHPSGTPRVVHAIVAGAGFESVHGKARRYSLTLRPWLWLATRAADLRIFQKKKVEDILKAVFQPYQGLVSFDLRGTYRKREYCVQYRESDFNFASRLMEDEGIFYYFRHEAGKHTLVVADGAHAHTAPAGLPATLDYHHDERIAGAVMDWRWSRQIQTTKVHLRDDAFQRPDARFDKEAEISRSHPHAGLAVFDYPAGVAPHADEASAYGSELEDEVKRLATWRVQEQQARFALVQGRGNDLHMAAGGKFKLDKHPIAAQNREYVALSTYLQVSQGGHAAGQGGQFVHECQFTAFPSDVPFRAARITPRPLVSGPQTATVAGPAGDEIHVDKHGRVKLQFHWHRDGEQANGNASCFVRVAQPSAGKGFGVVFLPRIGQEVVVEFLEGDPDRPLVVGSVYNGTNVPPYALPDSKSVSTLKSRSTAGGGAADFNELRFEDKAGDEYLLLHAQKDRLEFVEETLKSEIGKDEHRTVKKDRKEKIEGEYHLTVAKDVKQKLDGKLSIGVAKDILVKADGIYSLKTAKDITAQSGAAISLKSTGDLHLKIGANIGAEAAQNVHIKGGMNVVIEGGTQISIKAGGSSIVLGPDGVSITGAMVKINSGGSPGSGSGASPVAPTDPEAPDDPEVPEDPLTHR
jgi:type VI secretion system secreted protein VgrG